MHSSICGRWLRPLAVGLALAAMTILGGSAVAQDDVIIGPDPEFDPDNGYGPNNRPVHAFVSVSEDFGIPDLSDFSLEDIRASAGSLGTPLALANLGTYFAGPTIETTRFVTAGPVDLDFDSFPPPHPETDPTADFDNHQATVVGSFKTLLPDGAIHLMTPYPGEIVARVQEAWFNASPFLDDADATAVPRFPTTVQVALFIYDNQGLAGASVQEILDVVFGTVEGSPPVQIECLVTCEAEGVIFPHDPFDDGVLVFELEFDEENGVFELDACTPVAVDLKPDSTNNRVNGKSDKGVIPIAFLTTDAFDAVEELDPDTVVVVVYDEEGEIVSTVAPDKYSIEDVDGDGDDDVLFHFSVPDLTDGSDPALTSETDTLHLRGDTFAGACVIGSDSVEYVNSGN